MRTILFDASFDNGRDFYSMVAPIEVTDEELKNMNEVANGESDYDAEFTKRLVQELEQADRRKHGRSYRGYVSNIQISGDEEVEAVDNGDAEMIGDELVPSPGYEYLKFFVDRQTIRWAFDND